MATQMMNDGLTVLASMATPAVLLLANAMLILSTNQRLQSILNRIHETERTLADEESSPAPTDVKTLHDMLLIHARRARSAHRALLCFYGSAGAFIAVVVSLGLAGLGSLVAQTMALVTAFLGCGLLVCGSVLLIKETWLGIHATDLRFALVIQLCRELDDKHHRRQRS